MRGLKVPDGSLVSARRAVAVLFLVNALLTGTWVSRIPGIQAELGLSHSSLGLALFGLAFGALVAMPLAGWCASRYGSRRVCRVTALGCCLTLPLVALAPNAVWLGVTLFCFGGLHGAMDVAMNAQAVDVEAGYGRPIMSSFHALWSVGGFVGAAIGGVIASWRVAPLIHFAGTVLILAVLTVIVAYPRLLFRPRPPERAADAANSRPRKFIRPPLTLVGLGAVAFCVMLCEGAMADWSGIFLREVAGADEGFAPMGYAAFSVTMAAARFCGDWLSTRLGPVSLVRLGSMVAAVGLSVAVIFVHPAASAVGFAAVGAGLATIIPQVFSAAGRTPGVEAGPALATVTTLGYSGFLAGPPVIGFAAEWLGLRSALGIVVAICFVAAALAQCLRTREA